MGTIIRAVIAYFLLLLVVRLLGRRSVDHMTQFEMILLFLIGGMSIQSVVADDRSLTNAILAVMTVGLCHVSVSLLRHRSPTAGRLIDGTPIVLLGRGEWHKDRMAALRVHEQDVMAAARMQGIEKLEQIRYAVAERNGSITVVKQQDDDEDAQEAEREEPDAWKAKRRG
jgi:uncharacterized membrane protein YcaP (DUF421 family)